MTRFLGSEFLGRPGIEHFKYTLFPMINIQGFKRFIECDKKQYRSCMMDL